MSKTTSDHIIHRLREWGVRLIYGYPGDGINGLMGALNRAGNDPRFIQVRHEELAAFMACAHAKFTDEVGVCMATSGPGAIHLLNDLYDLNCLFKDVAHEYVHTIMVPAQIPDVIDRAIRIAMAQRTVTCVIVPNDVQEEAAVEETPHKHHYVPGGLGYAPPRVIPPDSELRRAADVLNAGGKVAMLVGQGARGAAAEAQEIAELLGAGVAKALLGKDVLPDTLPFVTGSIGLLGTKPSWDLMMECDTLLVVGSNLPYSEFFPKWGQARGVQIDIDGRMVGFRYPMEVNLVGDSRETLRALIPQVQRKSDRAWRQRVEKNVREWWEIVEARAMTSADPLNPQRVFWELSSRLPERCIITADSGSSANWFARDLKIRPGMRASLSGTLATMGPGVPYAIAAKFAHPDRAVIALVGDGAMQMNGINALITAKHYWREWTDPRLIVLVLHNNDLNQVTWEQRVLSGDPKFSVSQDLPDFPYARYAEMLGFDGIRVDAPEQLPAAWDAALSARRPVLVEAITDPDVPPLPPHITYKEAKGLSAALVKGDPDAWDVVRQSFVGKMKEFFPVK